MSSENVDPNILGSKTPDNTILTKQSYGMQQFLQSKPPIGVSFDRIAPHLVTNSNRKTVQPNKNIDTNATQQLSASSDDINKQLFLEAAIDRTAKQNPTGLVFAVQNQPQSIETSPNHSDDMLFPSHTLNTSKDINTICNTVTSVASKNGNEVSNASSATSNNNADQAPLPAIYNEKQRSILDKFVKGELKCARYMETVTDQLKTAGLSEIISLEEFHSTEQKTWFMNTILRPQHIKSFVYDIILDTPLIRWMELLDKITRHDDFNLAFQTAQNSGQLSKRSYKSPNCMLLYLKEFYEERIASFNSATNKQTKELISKECKHELFIMKDCLTKVMYNQWIRIEKHIYGAEAQKELLKAINDKKKETSSSSVTKEDAANAIDLPSAISDNQAENAAINVGSNAETTPVEYDCPNETADPCNTKRSRRDNDDRSVNSDDNSLVAINMGLLTGIILGDDSNNTPVEYCDPTTNVAITLTIDNPIAMMFEESSIPPPDHYTCIIGGGNENSLELLFGFLVALKLVKQANRLTGKLQNLQSLTFLQPSEYSSNSNVFSDIVLACLPSGWYHTPITFGYAGETCTRTLCVFTRTCPDLTTCFLSETASNNITYAYERSMELFHTQLALGTGVHALPLATVLVLIRIIRVSAHSTFWEIGAGELALAFCLSAAAAGGMVIATELPAIKKQLEDHILQLQHKPSVTTGNSGTKRLKTPRQIHQTSGISSETPRGRLKKRKCQISDSDTDLHDDNSKQGSSCHKSRISSDDEVNDEENNYVTSNMWDSDSE